MFNHILELLAICLVLAVVLATFLKYLLIILEKLAAIGRTRSKTSGTLLSRGGPSAT